MLADTSVWVDHLRRRNDRLAAALEQGEVHCHPFVVGELACGSLKQRETVLALLAALPQAPTVEHGEVLVFVERHQLMRSGLGWVDVHLLAAAALGRLAFWTLDTRLAKAAVKLGLSSSGA